MRTFALGDIHGCHQPLLALLNAIDSQPDGTLIFLDDMIDRGPDSKGLLTPFMPMKNAVRSLPSWAIMKK